jgi:pyruvate/2-oxoglutarate dehydrogenase complex dihydrolipoamide acyltransferase (E2) component
VDNREEREVRARIRDVVLDPDTIPDPRDVVLIGLMDACDLSNVVFSEDELQQAGERIKKIARMDFIVQAIAKDISEIQQAILEVIAYSGM